MAKIKLYDSNGVLQRIIDLDASTNHIEIRDSSDTDLMDVESHGSRHSYGGNDAIPDNGLRFSQLDKVFGSETTVTVTAGGTSTISKGIFLVSLGANTTVEYSPDGGTTWRTLYAAGTGGVVISDGTNVRLNNGGGADEDSYLLEIE